MREILTSKNLPPPKFRYSPLVKAGPFYHMAGMVALGADGQLISGGPEEETRQILRNLRTALPDFDLGLEDLVSARIFTTQFEEFPAINRAWEEVFADIDPPARAAVGVAALPLGASVEIEFTLHKD